MSPKAPKIRKLYERIISDKHEDPMAKYGAILAQGIIDAGGRNVTISLQSRSGHARMLPIVGLLIFTQYWYWYPLVNMLSLAFTPTAIIGLNKEHKMPKFNFISHAKPSQFAYPPLTPPPTAEKIEKVATAVLSTTAKAKARAQAKENKDKEKEKPSTTAMDVDASNKSSDALDTSGKTAEAGTETKDGEKKKEGKEKPKPEPAFELLQNPARVLPAQAPYVTLEENSRYKPIKRGILSDIVILKDLQPDSQETLITLSAPTVPGGPANDEGDEPPPPEPFEFRD